MKKIIFFLFVFISLAFSQSWNNTVTTSINESGLQKMEVFSNKDGNHIVISIYPGNSIKYYLINTSGSIVRSSTIETASGADFPNISGSNDIVYISYHLGNNIITKKSTNAGSSWSPLTSISLGGDACNGIDIAYDYRGLHIVYGKDDGETYYRKYNSSNALVDYKQVTDYSGETGGFPSITLSANKAHVAYNSNAQGGDPTVNQGDAKTRDKNLNTNTWENPQTVFGYPDASMVEKIFADNNYVYDFYNKFVAGLGQYHSDLYVKKRGVNSTSWSSATLLDQFSDVTYLPSITKTTDGKIHIVYPGTESVVYRNYNGSSWSSETTIGDGFISPSISAVSNDLYVTYKKLSSNYVKYRQYDADPLAPQNLSLTAYPDQLGDRPKLTWTANSEPDLSLYEIWRQSSDNQFMGSCGYPNTWQLIGTTSSTSYVDYSGFYLDEDGDCVLEYKIRAKDNLSKYSAYSNVVSTEGYWVGWKLAAKEFKETPLIFQLDQNYPNPFNPSTQIKYSIKNDGLVTIKVFDILGKEVAIIVNEFEPAGEYNASFNASNLPSGVYFYTITSGSFHQTKKMILLR